MAAFAVGTPWGVVADTIDALAKDPSQGALVCYHHPKEGRYFQADRRQREAGEQYARARWPEVPMRMRSRTVRIDGEPRTVVFVDLATPGPDDVEAWHGPR